MASLDRANLGEYLSAYLDDELTAEERLAVEQLIAADAEVRAQFDELRRTVDVVRSLPHRAAPPGMVDELTAMAERRELLDEGPAWSPRPHRPWWRSASTWLSAAAVLMIAVGGGFFVRSQLGHSDDETGRPSDMTLAMADKEDPIESKAPNRLLKSENALPVAPTPRSAVSRRQDDDQRKATSAEGIDRDENLESMSRVVQPEAAAKPLTDRTATPQQVDGAGVATTIGEHERPAVDQQLSFEKKLSVDPPAQALVEHDVSVEQNHLYVAVRDERDVMLAQQQLDQFALSNQYQNVEPSTPAPAIRRGDPLVMRQGRARSPMGEEVVAVARIPASQLMELQRSLEVGTGSQRSMQMRIGPVKAYDNDEVAQTIQSMQSSRRHGGMRNRPVGDTAIDRSARAGVAAADHDDADHDDALTRGGKDATAFNALPGATDAKVAGEAGVAAAGDGIARGQRSTVRNRVIEQRLRDDASPAAPIEAEEPNRRPGREHTVADAKRPQIRRMQSESGAMESGAEPRLKEATGDAELSNEETAGTDKRRLDERDQAESADQQSAPKPAEQNALLTGVGRAFQQMQQWFATVEIGSTDTGGGADTQDEYAAFSEERFDATDHEDELVTLVIHFQLPTMKANKAAPANGANGNAAGEHSVDGSKEASDG